MYKCCICQANSVPSRSHWLCSECKEKYDLDRPDPEWPEWARQCKALENKERRFDRELGGQVSYDDLPEDADIVRRF